MQAHERSFAPCRCCPLIDLLGSANAQCHPAAAPTPQAHRPPTADDLSPSDAATPAAAEWALVPEAVWDGLAATSTPGQAVLIRGETIAAVLPAAELPEHVDRVALPGCTAIPGLIDAHVHTTAAMGPAFLAAGVTTLRDTGNDLHWILGLRALHAEHPRAGPTILCCGHALDFDDPPPPLWNYMVREHRDAAALRASVDEHVAAGVDQIKCYARLDKHMLAAAAGQAKTHGKFVLAHLGGKDAFGEATMADAAAAGIDEFEHLVGLDTAWREADDEEVEAEVESLLASGLIIDPTLLVWHRYSGILDNALLHDSRRKWVHPGLLQTWSGFNWREDQFVANRHRLRGAMPRLQQFLQKAHARGVVVALGTDTPFPHQIPGFAVHDELALYVDAGLSPVEALRCATSTNAAVLGVADKIGRIAPGFVADLSIVRGDPTTDIFAVGAVERVVHSGELMEPAALFAAAQRLFERDDGDPVSTDLRGRVVPENPPRL